MGKKIHLLACFLIGWVFLSQFSFGQSSDELFPVKQKGKWGYFDKTGKIIIKPQFDDAGNFYEGLASVSIGTDSQGRVQYMDKEGNPVGVGSYIQD